MVGRYSFNIMTYMTVNTILVETPPVTLSPQRWTRRSRMNSSILHRPVGFPIQTPGCSIPTWNAPLAPCIPIGQTPPDCNRHHRPRLRRTDLHCPFCALLRNPGSSGRSPEVRNIPTPKQSLPWALVGIADNISRGSELCEFVCKFLGSGLGLRFRWEPCSSCMGLGLGVSGLGFRVSWSGVVIRIRFVMDCGDGRRLRCSDAGCLVCWNGRLLEFGLAAFLISVVEVWSSSGWDCYCFFGLAGLSWLEKWYEAKLLLSGFWKWMCSMVEAKMKLRSGNGTPHPRARRPAVHTSQEGHNLPSQVEHNVPDQPKHVPTRSSLDNLLSVHTQVTQTLHQVFLRHWHDSLEFFDTKP